MSSSFKALAPDESLSSCQSLESIVRTSASFRGPQLYSTGTSTFIFSAIGQVAQEYRVGGVYVLARVTDYRVRIVHVLVGVRVT